MCWKVKLTALQLLAQSLDRELKLVGLVLAGRHRRLDRRVLGSLQALQLVAQRADGRAQDANFVRSRRHCCLNRLGAVNLGAFQPKAKRRHCFPQLHDLALRLQ